MSDYSDRTRDLWSDFEEALFDFRQELIVPAGEPSPDAPRLGFKVRASLDRLVSQIQKDLSESWRE